MRNTKMVLTARMMNDLYEELVEVHGFGSEWARDLAVAYFKGGYAG